MDIRVGDSREKTPANDERDTTQPCQPLLISPKKLLLQSSTGELPTVESTSPQTIITVFDSYAAKHKHTSDNQTQGNRPLRPSMMHSALELANGPSQGVATVHKISASTSSSSSFDCHKECLNGERQYQNGYQHDDEDDDDEVTLVEEDSIESKQRQREALMNIYEEANWIPTGAKFKVVYIPHTDTLLDSDYVSSVVSKAFSSVSIKPEREDSFHSMAIGPTGDEGGQNVGTEPHDDSSLEIAQLSPSSQERFNHLWAQVNTAVTLEERQTAGQTLLSEYEQNLDEEAVAVIQGLSSSQTDPNIEVVDFPFEDDTQHNDPNEENVADMAPDTDKQVEDNLQNSDPNADQDKEPITNEMDGPDTALDREVPTEYTSHNLQVNYRQLEPNVAVEKACSAALIVGKEEGLPREIPIVMPAAMLPESGQVTGESLLPPRRKRGRPRKNASILATPSRPAIQSALFPISQVSSSSNSIYVHRVVSHSLKIEEPSISGPFQAPPLPGGPIGVSASRRGPGRPRKVPLSEKSQSVSQPSDQSSVSQGARRSSRTPKQVSIFDPTPRKRAKNPKSEPSPDDEGEERLPIRAKRGRPPKKVTATTTAITVAKRAKTSKRVLTKKEEDEDEENDEEENEDDEEEDDDAAVQERRAAQREYNRRYREKVRDSEEHRRRKAESQRKWLEKKLRENPLYFAQARMSGQQNGEGTVQRKRKANKPNKASKHKGQKRQ